MRRLWFAGGGFRMGRKSQCLQKLIVPSSSLLEAGELLGAEGVGSNGKLGERCEQLGQRGAGID